MSIPTHRASKQSQIPVMKPLPPRRSTLGRVGLPIQAPQFLMPQFAQQGSQFVAGLGGPLPQFIADPVQVAHEEFSGGTNSGSYFTNLMSNGIPDSEVHAADQPDEIPPHDHEVIAADQPDDLPPPDEGAGQGHAQGVARGPQKKGKNFSVDEDLLLVSAWLNVSLDAIQGVDQSRSTYWKRIHDYFHGNKKFESDRSQGSLMNRWSGIQHDVNVFAGCLSKIEARNHSGWSVDDKVAGACKMFKADDKLHRNFPYMHCWMILKDKPKWIERRKHMSNSKSVAKKQKTTANSSPSSAPLSITAGNVDGGQPAEGAQERPAGRKKEQQKLRQRSSMEAMEYLVAKKKEADAEKELKKEERCKKAFALQEERIRIEKERVDLKREVEEERIMNIDMSTLSYKQQQYYERRQDEILAKRLSN